MSTNHSITNKNIEDILRQEFDILTRCRAMCIKAISVAKSSQNSNTPLLSTLFSLLNEIQNRLASHPLVSSLHPKMVPPQSPSMNPIPPQMLHTHAHTTPIPHTFSQNATYMSPPYLPIHPLSSPPPPAPPFPPHPPPP